MSETIAVMYSCRILQLLRCDGFFFLQFFFSSVLSLPTNIFFRDGRSSVFSLNAKCTVINLHDNRLFPPST